MLGFHFVVKDMDFLCYEILLKKLSVTPSYGVAVLSVDNSLHYLFLELVPPRRPRMSQTP